MFIKMTTLKGREDKTDQNLKGTLERKKRFIYVLLKIMREKKEEKRDREIYREEDFVSRRNF